MSKTWDDTLATEDPAKTAQRLLACGVGHMLPFGEDIAAVLTDTVTLATEVARLREAVDDARRFAAGVEAQNAQALALHQPTRSGACSSYCDGDQLVTGEQYARWPCPTALALGAEALGGESP